MKQSEIRDMSCSSSIHKTNIGNTALTAVCFWEQSKVIIITYKALPSNLMLPKDLPILTKSIGLSYLCDAIFELLLLLWAFII